MVECTLYLALASIFLSFFNNMGIRYVEEFKNYSYYSKNLKYLSDIDIYINSRVNGAKVKKIYSNNNQLKFEFINRENKKQVDTIKKKGNDLVINYKKEYEPATIDYAMLKNIEDFKIYNKKNIFYIVIKQKDAKERIFCYEKS